MMFNAMMIFGTILAVVLSIGIIGGTALSGLAVFRLLPGKGGFHGRAIHTGWRILIAAVCILNACVMLAGGYFGGMAYSSYLSAEALIPVMVISGIILLMVFCCGGIRRIRRFWYFMGEHAGDYYD